MFTMGVFLSIVKIQFPFCLHQFFPLTACDSTFLSLHLSPPPLLAMQNNQNYGATDGGGAGLPNGWYYGPNGWYVVVTGGTNGQATARNAIQGYTWDSGCFPSTSCMADLNLSGTSSAR
jgi:hypothetical protein